MLSWIVRLNSRFSAGRHRRCCVAKLDRSVRCRSRLPGSDPLGVCRAFVRASSVSTYPIQMSRRSDHLARTDSEGDVLKDIVGTWTIREGNVAQLDRAFRRRQSCARLRGLSGGALRISPRRSTRSGPADSPARVGKPQDRLSDLPSNHVEGDEFSDSQVTIDNGLGPRTASAPQR